MNIDTDKGIIEANSYHKNYVKEASGITPHTIRTVDGVEANMLRGLEASIMDEGEAVTIVLTDAETGDSVRRQVTDISFAGLRYGFDEATISWRHVPLENGE